MTTYIPIIAAVTALVAVVVGPLVTVYVAHRQIKANTIAVNRQQWINTLRDELSNYLAAMALAGSRSASLAAPGTEHQESLETLCRLESKIRLLLNPNETDHSDLIALLRQASAFTWVDNVSDVSQMPVMLDNYRTEIIIKSQAILKREWNRVKDLK